MPFPRRLTGHLRAATKALIQLDHSTFDDFTYAKDGDPTRRGLYVKVEQILPQLVDAIRADLAPQHVHVGYSVLETAVYSAIRDGSSDPVADVVAGMRAQNLDAPGFLIYPLYGFGILRPPSVSFLGGMGLMHFVSADVGLAVIAGPRDLPKLEAAFASISHSLGVVGTVDPGELRHFAATHEATSWLLKNPLLIVPIRSITMGARENQAAYMGAVGHRVAYLAMCSVLRAPRDTNRTLARSTHGANNFETLEFSHYFVFESPGTTGSFLRSDRIPMNLQASALRQLADAPFDIDPDVWNDPALIDHLAHLADAFRDLEDLHQGVRTQAPSVRSRANIVRKIRTSLHWYRRSYASFADEREAVVAMAVAFEALVSDGYSAGITNAIIARVRHCIQAQGASSDLADAVATLFNWRGAVVHRGETQDEVDLSLARKAYGYCFCEVVKRTSARSGSTTLTMLELFDGVVLTWRDRLWRYLVQLKRALLNS